MIFWTWGLITFMGVLFIFKMVYVICTALVLPVTQGALYVSTSGARIRTFLDAVPMNPGQVFVDLGCGDGRVLCTACNRYGVRAVGYELNPLAYVRARLRCMGKKDVRVVWGNFWKADLRGADVVFCYLFPDVMGRVAEKIRTDVKPGAVVVSCNFPVPEFVPNRVLRPAGALHHDPIYVYVKS